MISVNVDDNQLSLIIQETLAKRVAEIEHRHTFWDMKELCRQTCMSEPFIKEHFFFDKRFPKYRVGRKWLFPAKATEEFLITWLREQ